MGKKTADELDKLAGFGKYEAPEPRDAPKVVTEFETQKEAAEFMKDLSIVFGQGASQGTGDEALAGMKTKSFSSPEYIEERNLNRNRLNKARDNVPLSPIIEGIGSVATTAAVPFMRGAPVAKELISSIVQGFGEAEEMGDVPEEAATSLALQGGMELGGKALKRLVADDATKILTRSVGAKANQVARPSGKGIQDSVERLNKAGFFKQGEVDVDPFRQSFKRSTKSLTDFFKPQSLDSLYERAEKSLTTLKGANNEYLKNKRIKMTDLQDALDKGISEMTYDPQGFNVQAREVMADDVSSILMNDLYSKGHMPSPSGSQTIPASAIEEAKRSLSMHMGSPAFKKRAEDLGLNPEALNLFRNKLDELVDSVGGPAYKKNNDMMHDLIEVKNTIENKLNKSYVDSGTGIADVRGWKDKLLDTVSPTPVDIMRSDLATAAEGKVLPEAAKIMKRSFVEGLTEDNTQYYTPEKQGQGMFNKVKPAFPFKGQGSSMITPRELINYKIPRTTQGILENKERVLAKLAQNNVPHEMIDTIAQALNDDHEAVSNIAPLVVSQFPTLFERSKYMMFDGQFLDPNDRAKAADDISKREDMDSIARARAINTINKTGKMPEGIA